MLIEWPVIPTKASPRTESRDLARLVPMSDKAVRLYYRFYSGTRVGDKFMCVAVKFRPGDPFVLTAYLTDKPKKGTVLWSANT